METIKQEIINVRQLGVRGFNYTRGIQKYNISRKKVAKRNPRFDEFKGLRDVEIRKHIKFDVEVESIGVF